MKPVYKRAIKITAVVLTLVLLVCFVVPPVMAQINADTWAKRCIGEYTLLQDAYAMHYTHKYTMQYYNTPRGDTTFVETSDVKFRGSYSLEDKIDNDGERTVTLTGGYRVYKKEFTGEEDPQWVEQPEIVSYKKPDFRNWNEREYVFESIKGSLTGIEVVFFKDAGAENCTVSRQTTRLSFFYDSGGKLQSIKSVFTTYNGSQIDPEDIHSTITSEYTFLSFDEDAINAVLEEAKLEAKEE